MQVLVPFSGAAEHCRGNLQAKPTSDIGTRAEQEEEEGGRGSLAKFWSESNLHPSAFECLCLHLCCERCMQCTLGRKGWVEGVVICCRRATYRQTTNCSCSSSRPGFPFSSVWPGCLLGSMGSLLSSLSSWRPTLGAGTYTVLGDTNGLFERYLTEPGTSSSSVPSLTELPSLIVAQLLPESSSSRGPVADTPRISPQLPSRPKKAN